MDVVEVKWFGLDLLEPMTWITDVLVAIFCLYFGNRLYKKSKKKIATYWSLFFWVMALSTFIAGFAHAFLNYLGETAHLVARSLSVVGLFFAEMASFLIIPQRRIRNILMGVSIIKMFTILSFLIIMNNFELVKLNSLISLLGIVFTIHIVQYFKEKNYTGKMLFFGILLGLVAGIFNTFKISAHEWFTYHDFGHFFMIGSFYCFFKGVSDSEYLLHPKEI